MMSDSIYCTATKGAAHRALGNHAHVFNSSSQKSIQHPKHFVRIQTTALRSSPMQCLTKLCKTLGTVNCPVVTLYRNTHGELLTQNYRLLRNCSLQNFRERFNDFTLQIFLGR